MRWYQKAIGKEKDKVLRDHTHRNIGNVVYFSYLFWIPEQNEKKKIPNNVLKAVTKAVN